MALDVVTGQMGSGKSTLAKKLRDKYDIVEGTDLGEVVEGKWVTPPKEERVRLGKEKEKRLIEAHRAGKRVLLEGVPPGIEHYSDVISEADRMVTMDPGYLTRMLRLVGRSFDRGTSLTSDIPFAIRYGDKEVKSLERLRELIADQHTVESSEEAEKILEAALSKQSSAQDRLKAVIVKGNPYYVGEEGVQREQADKFYGDIQTELESQGYDVETDPGEPHTTPADADLWVGHSRGADRLRFAPEGTRTVVTDDYEDGAYKALLEALLKERGSTSIADFPVDERPLPGDEHYTVNDRLREALSKKASRTFTDNNKTYDVEKLWKVTGKTRKVEPTKILETLGKTWGHGDKKYGWKDVISDPKKYTKDTKSISAADLKYPILLRKGVVVDGIHRLVKAMQTGKPVKAINLSSTDMKRALIKKSSVTKEDIHNLADDLNIPWDDDPAFMDYSERVTGKTCLDKMTPPELEKLKKSLKGRGRLKTSLEKVGVLAHISGPSGSGKTTLLNALSKTHPGLVVKDLDEIDDEAEQQLGFSDIRKRNYTGKMLSILADRRQKLLDAFLKNNRRNPVVLGGHHTEGPHVLKFPTENRVMLDIGPVRSAWRGYLRDDTRKLLEFPSDYREAKDTIDELLGAGYTPTSASDIKKLVSRHLEKTSTDKSKEYKKHHGRLEHLIKSGGWWQADPDTGQMQDKPDSGIYVGDPSSDILGDAHDAVVKAYLAEFGRPPTAAELHSAWQFTTGAAHTPDERYTPSVHDYARFYHDDTGNTLPGWGGGNASKTAAVSRLKTALESPLYHGSSVEGIEEFEPRVTKGTLGERLKKPAVFATPDRGFALSMASPLATDDNIAIGYHSDTGGDNRQFYIDELKPGMLEEAYERPAWLYHLAAEGFSPAEGLMAEERISENPVRPTKSEKIENLLEALRAVPGIRINRYADVPEELEGRAKTSTDKSGSAEEFAPGIPADRKIHDLPTTQDAKWRLALQLHKAKKAGPHWDLRLVDPESGRAHSWAVPKRKWPTKKKRLRLAIMQPTHTSEYSSWEGEIPEGYGAGKVKLLKNLETSVSSSPDKVVFNVPGKGNMILRRTEDNKWLLMKAKKDKTSKLTHPEQRLKERTGLPLSVYTRLKDALKSPWFKTPRGVHHFRLDGKGYAVIKNIKGKPVISSFLTRSMAPPGQDLTARVGKERIEAAIKQSDLKLTKEEQKRLSKSIRRLKKSLKKHKNLDLQKEVEKDDLELATKESSMSTATDKFKNRLRSPYRHKKAEMSPEDKALLAGGLGLTATMPYQARLMDQMKSAPTALQVKEWTPENLSRLEKAMGTVSPPVNQTFNPAHYFFTPPTKSRGIIAAMGASAAKLDPKRGAIGMYQNKLDILAHEMGHSTMMGEGGLNKLRLGLTKGLRNPFLAAGLPLATVMAAYNMDPDSEYAWAPAAVGAGYNVPILAEEGLATKKGLGALKRMVGEGALGPETLRNARRTLGKAFGSYGIGAAMAAGLPAAITYAKKRHEEENQPLSKIKRLLGM